MADHLDPWRMQFPPLIAIVGRVALAIFGDASVLAARVPAALAAAAIVAVALATARRLGGSRTALALAALALLAAPVYMRAGVLFQPVVFDQLWYAIAALGLLIAGQGESRRGWLTVGVALGLGGLTKFSAAFYLAGIAAAVLVTRPLRAQLATRWPWVAAAVGALVALPSVTGQTTHGWPVFAQMRQLSGAQLAHVSWGGFLAEQPLMLGGGALLVVLALVSEVGRGRTDDANRTGGRPLAVAAVAIVALIGALHGKAYYAAPVYVPLVAIGAVAAERIGARRRWVVPAVATAMLAVGVALLPAGVPILAPGPMARYAARLGITETNTGTRGELPQDYADMIGWEQLADATAAAWRAVPEPERAHTAILATNYGRAGALARYGPARALPYPVSVNGDFWAWGPGPATTTTLLVVGGDPERLRPFCGSLLPLARVRNPLGVEEERDVALTLCRDLREPLPALWRRIGVQWG